MGKISSAVILAAGYSTRLGQPKALVMWNEETLIERSIRLLEDAGIKKIVVVTNKELMAAFIPLVGNHSIVVNPSPENGRTGSLQIGIKSILSNLPNIPQFWLFLLTDVDGNLEQFKHYYPKKPTQNQYHLDILFFCLILQK